jgi:hypothetical protein
MSDQKQICTKCCSEKSTDQFHRDKNTKTGLRYICKSCAVIASKSAFTARNSSTDGLEGVWRAMKQRCSDPKHKSYARYGDRGIMVCDQWVNSLDAFIEWARKNGYVRGLQLDRIDNDRGYCPENCQWITPVENSRKSTATRLSVSEAEEIRMLVSKGVKQSEIAKRFSVDPSTISVLNSGKTWR